MLERGVVACSEAVVATDGGKTPALVHDALEAPLLGSGVLGRGIRFSPEENRRPLATFLFDRLERLLQTALARRTGGK